ncbi:hypothetical protein CIHG_01702 [Coccidioides immitis H538.4]|uniref:SET domain-containing protein n=1 Tax=Coccidioides immitis H538.4 TaxID=396776 RepID=A0A0J8U9X7_COCIT|nr:hypothetical protein CIHG_01702 [Coccidioides immitis H538.4]
MTETSFANTHSTAHLFPVTAPTLSPPLVNGTHSGQQDDEEPYTIKCICIFDDDDGSTVFCERCETWQHIVCYYDDQEVPEIHNCTDCEPRVLDSKRATERQKRLREQNDSGDRKGKRSGAKYQKKKTKDAASATDTTNGWNPHDKSGSNSVSKDQQPPTKKQRTSHRSSASVSSVAAALTSDSRKRGASSIVLPSPTKPPSHPPIPLYSQEFLHLYDNDHVNTNMHGNLFDTLGLAGDLASWVQDPSALALVANGRSAKDVFTYSDQPLDHSKWPVLSKQSVTDTSIDYDGRHPTWRFLKVDKDVRKDEIVGEVRGKVGHFRDYCLDPNSRWQELRHPEPFVFFHPQLPIYIDSRKEGTLLRYIRRSCRPNVTLKTFITNEIEYHFCFVANQDISGDSEITTTWYLDPQLFPASNGFVKQEGPNDGIPDAAAISISNVLAHFGGCACDPSQPCLLANVDRRQRPRNSDSNVKQLNGRRKKSKNRNNVSPVSTGRATNSRAGSESRKHREDEDQSENRSVTSAKASPGSANSRRESRLTPKTSAASTPRIGSPLARANYVDCSIQTDSDETDPHYVPPKSPPRPCFVPLTKRLLSRYHHDRLKLDESKGLNHAPVKQAISSMPPPPTPKLPLSPQSEKDIEMKDVDTSITLQRLARPASRSSDHAPIAELPFKPPRLPLPSTAAHNFPVRYPSGDAPGKLRVQPPEAQPSSPVSFSNNPSSGPHPTYLPPPLSTKLQGPPSSLTPGLGITAPSPVKKRMSLGDYMRSRGNLTTPSAEKSHTLILSGGQPPTPSAAPGNSTESGHTPTKPTRTADGPIKRESDTTSDVVMKDASSLPPHTDKSSSPPLLSRDPRINPST